MSARVLLADDHPVVLRALRDALSARHDIVGEARTGDELLFLARTITPDVLLFDLGMPGQPPILVAQTLVAERRQLRLIALADRLDAVSVHRLWLHGVQGLLLKTTIDEVSRAVTTVLRGERYLAESVTSLVDPDWHPRAPQAAALLTLRQQRILHLIACGKTTHAIADTLQCSPRTVEEERGLLRSRYRLESPADFLRLAVQHGLFRL